MSKHPEMPKFKNLRPMPPDHPFYRRGYLVGVPILMRKSGSSRERSERRAEASRPQPGERSAAGLNWKGWGTLANRLGDNVSLIMGRNIREGAPARRNVDGEE